MKELYFHMKDGNWLKDDHNLLIRKILKVQPHLLTKTFSEDDVGEDTQTIGLTPLKYMVSTLNL